MIASLLIGGAPIWGVRPSSHALARLVKGPKVSSGRVSSPCAGSLNLVGLVADHHDRARRVGSAVFADRSKQHPDERAVASATQHQQVGALGNVQERRAAGPSITRATTPRTPLSPMTSRMVASSVSLASAPGS